VKTILSLNGRKTNPRWLFLAVLGFGDKNTSILERRKYIASVWQNITIGLFFLFGIFSLHVRLLFLYFWRQRHQIYPSLLRFRYNYCLHQRVEWNYIFFLLHFQCFQTNSFYSLSRSPSFREVLKHFMDKLIQTITIPMRYILELYCFLLSYQFINRQSLVRNLQAT